MERAPGWESGDLDWGHGKSLTTYLRSLLTRELASEAPRWLPELTTNMYTEPE